MRRLLTISSAICVLVAAIGTAAADTGRFRDPRDSSGPLDLRVLRHGHGGNRVRHSIETQGDWANRDLHCGNKPCRGLINVYFNTDKDDNNERLVQIYHREGELRAHLHKQWYDERCIHDPLAALCNQGSRYVGDARLWRTDHSSIAFSLPVKKLQRKGKLRSYTWRAEVYFRRDDPCRQRSYYDQYRDEYSCIDYAPDSTWIRHRL